VTGQWRLGMRNLLRNRRRSLFTGLSLAVGTLGLVTMLGSLLGLERYLRIAQMYFLHSGHLAIYKQGGLDKPLVRPQQYSLNAEEQARLTAILKADPEVDFQAGYLVAAGLVSNGCKAMPFRAVGIDVQAQKRIVDLTERLGATPELNQLVQGRRFWEGTPVPGAIAITRGLATHLGKRMTYDAVPPQTGTGATVIDCASPEATQQLSRDANVQLLASTFSGGRSVTDAEVLNIFHSGFTELEDDSLLLPLSDMQQIYDTDAVTYVSVYLKDPERADAVGRRLSAQFQGNGLPVSVYTWHDPQLAPMYSGLHKVLYVLGLCIFTILALLAGLSVVNTVTLSLIERKAELGTFRALGFRRKHLLGMLLAEGTWLAGAGVSVGLLLSLAAAAVLNHLNLRYQPPGLVGTIQFVIYPAPALCLAVALVLAAVAALSTLIAARTFLRQPIVALLYRR